MEIEQSTPVRRLVHFTPLRYPGGKGKLAPFVKRLLELNDLCDGKYVEPYAGGCAVGLELLFHEYVSEIYLNDISPLIYSFWWSVLHSTEDLCRLISDTPVTIESWDRNKHVMANYRDYDPLSVGFAAFFLNRTNRSGILHAGVIGGKQQLGKWRIDARYNARELVFRIESIANLRSRITLSSLDAHEFISSGIREWPRRTLIYCDPPYYRKGRHLYYDYYNHSDHLKIADLLCNKVETQHWMVSYDDADEVKAMYPSRKKMAYLIGYSAREVRDASEVIFFSDSLKVPSAGGTLRPLRVSGA